MLRRMGSTLRALNSSHMEVRGLEFTTNATHVLLSQPRCSASLIVVIKALSAPSAHSSVVLRGSRRTTLMDLNVGTRTLWRLLAAIPTQYGRDLQHTGAYLRSSIWLHIVCPPETMARLCPRPSFTSVPRGLLHVHPSLSRSSLWAALLDLHALFTACTPLIIHIYRASALYALFRS